MGCWFDGDRFAIVWAVGVFEIDSLSGCLVLPGDFGFFEFGFGDQIKRHELPFSFVVANIANYQMRFPIDGNASHRFPVNIPGAVYFERRQQLAFERNEVDFGLVPRVIDRPKSVGQGCESQPAAFYDGFGFKTTQFPKFLALPLASQGPTKGGEEDDGERDGEQVVGVSGSHFDQTDSQINRVGEWIGMLDRDVGSGYLHLQVLQPI